MMRKGLIVVLERWDEDPRELLYVGMNMRLKDLQAKHVHRACQVDVNHGNHGMEWEVL
jgi:hypothetical protein